jgi:diphthamide biosynthesis enzyme Dph1/Dph2-like protein
MFQLGKTIVSEDILEKDFVCNLSACHGACCVDDISASLLDTDLLVHYGLHY